ncbi:MAG: glycosyltransferase family 9 protein [Armatimonadetes bacterium]|nr:glycosyltransferase family 9 protein [Armatimonadota bacterium]
MTGQIKKVCMIRFGGMGDILLATPALRAVSETFNTEAIDIIVGKRMGDAVTGIPYIRRVTEWDKAGADANLPNFIRFLAELRRERYDLFLNFQPGSRSILMGLASGAKRVLTFTKDRRKQRETGRVRHAIDDFTKELKPLGIETVTDRHMNFHVPEAARESCADVRRAHGVAGRYIVVNPASTRLVNRYPPERWAEVIDELTRTLPGFAVVLSGAPNECELANAVLQGVRPGANAVSLAGLLTVKELGALLESADCVLTGDTGPLHIASAVGAPVVCLSGAADPDRTGPVSPRDLVVIRRDLPCVPCQDRVCRRSDIACMTGLPIEWVVNAATKRMEKL